MAAMAETPPTMTRTRPNILITGTPGAGKTNTSSMVAERTGLRHVECSELVKSEGCHEGWDEGFQSYTLDEDKLCDVLEPMMAEGGNVVDFHSCDFFPERWFDLVLVLTCDNTALYDRLVERGYAAKKVEENVQCEIMQVILQEAKESYAEEVVHQVTSDTIDDMESNVNRVAQWMEQW
eukprot:CAMPEP_0119529420 /NCGR_PEP_ID=MMETSP1344-20130328/43435_1 /TAXON_ID=236787 /ORGANISM="Florenciella parvula, Strain CCMP2471" /LENGTH=178 /DNA_ID=CAMNT_0007569053 /DNA_START=37 /DNA_END=570 /DNA_ORIENTATION=-